MIDEYDDEALGREDILTRKARRLDQLDEEKRDSLVVAVLGTAMAGMGAAAGWFAATAVRNGYLDDGSRLVYAAESPGDFWESVAFVGALGLACAVLGVQMLLHARREHRRNLRLAERLRRVGRGTR